MLTKVYIPYKGYFSSPFARWQGSMANENAIVLAAETAKRWLAEKSWDPKIFDYLFLGITVHQQHGFYGGPWAAAMMGATGIPGLLVSQACSTSTVAIYQASVGVETGMYHTPICLMTDRCSNGPHAVWPNPQGPGGQVISEDWLMDNFGRDPWAGEAMVKTAENVAAEAGITREKCDAVTLRRYQQYQDALADDRAFQKRYMYPVMLRVSKKKTIMLGKCIYQAHKDNPDIQEAIPIKGCPPKPADMLKALHQAGIEADPGLFENIEALPGFYMGRYKDKPEYDEAFFKVN